MGYNFNLSAVFIFIGVAGYVIIRALEWAIFNVNITIG